MSVPLVLVPGMNCSPALWAGVVPQLVVPQLTGGMAGAGGTSAGLVPPQASQLASVGSPQPGAIIPDVVHAEATEPSLQASVARLLDELPPRFDLCGLSLGGIVAMALVRTAPERVRRLALLSTNSRPPTDAQRASWMATLARLDSGASARDVQQELLGVLLADGTAVQEAGVLAQADEVGADRLRAQLLCQLTRVDERPGLRAVRARTVVVAAERDALCPIERHEEIASLVPGASLVTLPGAGHLSPVQAPDAVARALRAWLDA